MTKKSIISRFPEAILSYTTLSYIKQKSSDAFKQKLISFVFLFLYTNYTNYEIVNKRREIIVTFYN